MARPTVLLRHDKPCLTTASVSLPSAHSSVQTPKIQWQGHCILQVAHGATQNTHGKSWLSTCVPCCHLANVSHQRPWQTWTPLLLMDSFLKGYFYIPRIKHPLKITVSVPEPLIVMLWHRLLWALHQLEPSTCGILKLGRIRYITFQINSGKLYLKYATSCYWFFTVKDKHGSFPSNAEVILAALAKLGQRLQICCCLPHLRKPQENTPI